MKIPKLWPIRFQSDKPKEKEKKMAAPVRTGRAAKPVRHSEVQWSDISGNVQKWMNHTLNISPAVDRAILQFLIQASHTNRELSAARKYSKHLASTQLKLVITDRSDADVRKIQQRLNEMAQRIRPYGGKLSGLVRAYFDQLLTTGAISAEDILTTAMDRVHDVNLVPVINIEFKQEGGAWVPYQKKWNGTESIKLDAPTYRYVAGETLEGSPYGIPPALSAINDIIMNMDIDENVKFILHKMGILGLMVAMLALPEDYDPDNADDINNFNTALQQRITDLSDNFKDGMLVTANDMEFEVHSPTGEARGAVDILDRKREDSYQAVGLNPMIIGASKNPVQTFAKVIYVTEIRKIETHQDIVESAVTDSLLRDLALAGIDPSGVTLMLKRNPAFDPLAEAQARTTDLTGDLKAMDKGLVDPNWVSEKYYDAPVFDPSKIDNPVGGSAFMSPNANRYTHTPRSRHILDLNGNRFELKTPRVELWTGRNDRPTVCDCGKCRTGRNVHPTEALAATEKELDKWVRKYLREMKPVTDEATEKAVKAVEAVMERSTYQFYANADDFAERNWNTIATAFGTEMSLPETQDVVDRIAEETYRHFKLEETAAFDGEPPVTFTFTPIDQRTLDFTARVDNYYISKYIGSDQSRNQGMEFLREEFLEKGADLFDRTKPEVFDKFRRALGGSIDHLSDTQLSAITDTSVVRMRNDAELNQFREAGVVKAKWIRVGSYDCPVCNPFGGLEWEVAPAIAQLDKEMGMTAQEYAEYIKSQPQEPRTDPESALISGEKPPLHPRCRCRMVAVFE